MPETCEDRNYACCEAMPWWLESDEDYDAWYPAHVANYSATVRPYDWEEEGTA